MPENNYESRDVACPACFSPAGKPCTAPTETGRRNVPWAHYAREHASQEQRRARENGAG